MNLSGITYSLCLLRAPVINSETKGANQTKRACFIGKQRGMHKDQIGNIQNEKFDLVAASHKLIHIIPVQYIDTSFYMTCNCCVLLFFACPRCPSNQRILALSIMVCLAVLSEAAIDYDYNKANIHIRRHIILEPYQFLVILYI